MPIPDTVRQNRKSSKSSCGRLAPGWINAISPSAQSRSTLVESLERYLYKQAKISFKNMATLKEDIKSQSDWIIKAFAVDGFKLDHTMDSIIEVDRFFTVNMKGAQPKKGGRLYGKGFGPILFSIGSYVGETIIKNVKGAEWITDDNDPQGELNVSLKLPNDWQIWPIQKVIKRFQNGSEDAIYPYVHTVTKEFTNLPFKEEFWTLTAETDETEQVNPWWKFWQIKHD